jgi:hypothetical protein
MLPFSRLVSEFSLTPEFVALIKTQNGVFESDELHLERHQAARLLALADVHKELKSLSREDILKLYKALEWPFKHPPSLTFDKAFSNGFRIQVIPKRYLVQVELLEAKCEA